jgi:rare lipoprotein A
MTTERLRTHPKRTRFAAALAVIAAGLAFAQPASALPTTGRTAPPPAQSAAYRPAHSTVGIASWYGPGFAGKRTANGEILHPKQARTAAHRSLPLGTVVLVTNLKNGSQSEVRINDRGPYSDGRMIDLSEQAARDLGMLDDGVAPVRIQVVTEN